jgi:hypothetical protein
LALSEQRQHGRRSYYFRIEGGQKWFDFVLSDEFLMDLPGTPELRAHLDEYLPPILARFKNYSPREFLSVSGTPFGLNVSWPFKAHPSREVIWCHVEVEDLRFPDLLAMTTPVIWMLLDDTEFRLRPLARIEAVVNAIRTALDKSEIQFYRRDEHPSQTQEVKILEKQRFSRTPEDLVEQFLVGKVFWLGFKRGGQSTPVWVADPWDASYLGVSVKDLIQAAQVLRARGVISLASDSQFASAGDTLLLSLPRATAARDPIDFRVSSQTLPGLRD